MWQSQDWGESAHKYRDRSKNDLYESIWVLLALFLEILGVFFTTLLRYNLHTKKQTGLKCLVL